MTCRTSRSRTFGSGIAEWSSLRFFPDLGGPGA
jgi:hypothetical protein